MNYQSPFSWRYASQPMRQIWSEHHKREVWRKIWLTLAEVQMEYGLVGGDQVEDIRAHADQINLPRALEIEAEIHHDLMAEAKTFAEQCAVGGGVLHIGATSMDIEDNADILRMKEALVLILKRLDEVLLAFADRIQETAAVPSMAFTHLQPAEPTTLGYRLASHAQDLLNCRDALRSEGVEIRGKGFKGAVGTAAAYVDLIGLDNFQPFEELLSRRLGIKFFPVTTQTYPRSQDYRLVSALAGLGAVLSKFAFDLRLLQSPPIGEWAEPFGKKQVGSSAMPFKRNPINAEKVDSLARLLGGLPNIAWQNASQSLLERTLDDSANRRSLLPEAFLITDELLGVTLRLIRGMQFNLSAIKRNLENYAPFAATERILMALARAGADRQVMHEKLRGYSITAWDAVQTGKPNPLMALLQADTDVSALLGSDQVAALFDVAGYTGIAEQRAKEIVDLIQDAARSD